jgi:ATP-dependent Clp protease ATP-binding subunit ClpA
MFERFTKDARAIVTNAQEQARELGHSQIGTEDLLLALLADRESVGARVLAGLGVTEAAVRTEVTRASDLDAEALGALGIDLDAVRRKAEEAFGPGALERSWPGRGLFRRGGGGHRGFSPGAKKTLELALREAIALKHGYIGTEHLLLGLTWDDRGPAGQILRRLGVDLDHQAMRTRVLDELGRAA